MTEEFFSSNTPDAPTPLSSSGEPEQKYRNAAGDFDLSRSLERKPKSRKDLDQPKFTEDDATKRYYGDFSIEAKRNVMDLLSTHPKFGVKGNMRMNRVENNTREVMPNDPTKRVEHGGLTVYQDLPQASQTKYSDGAKNH